MIGVLNEKENYFNIFSLDGESDVSNAIDATVTIGPTTDTSKSLSISFKLIAV